MVEIKNYASNSWYSKFTFLLIIAGTYLLYKILKAITGDNEDDDLYCGIMIRTAYGVQA